MIQYRAVLVDPGRPEPNPPVQTITSSMQDVEDWAVTVLAGRDELPGPSKTQVSDQATVEVFMSTEAAIKTYDRATAKRLREEKSHRQEGRHE